MSRPSALLAVLLAFSAGAAFGLENSELFDQAKRTSSSEPSAVVADGNTGNDAKQLIHTAQNLHVAKASPRAEAPEGADKPKPTFWEKMTGGDWMTPLMFGAVAGVATTGLMWWLAGGLAFTAAAFLPALWWGLAAAAVVTLVAKLASGN